MLWWLLGAGLWKQVCPFRVGVGEVKECCVLGLALLLGLGWRSVFGLSWLLGVWDNLLFLFCERREVMWLPFVVIVLFWVFSVV